MSDSNWSEPDWQRELRIDPRATAKLITLALTTVDEEAAWEPVVVLHYRANREVLKAAHELSLSDCPTERELAANILGQLGVPDRIYPKEAIGLLLNMLEREQVDAVLQAIGVALGHQDTPLTIEPMTLLRNHSSAEVRWSVAYALAGQEDERAIQALIELSEDPDGGVRDWATFALGSQLELDTPAIREALARRLEDPHEEAQGEAMIGLAKRGDTRVVEPVLRELTSDQVRVYAIEAAGLIGDPRLYSALLDMRQECTDDCYSATLLKEAIARCTPGTEST